MKKALVVDDTKNIRILLTKTLELEGFEIKSASTGAEALDIIRKEAFDLIFLDIKLPEVSGTEVLRKIRGEGNNTPVIIITAYPTVKNAVDCVQLGAITYIQKPFTADRLRNTLEQFHLSANSDSKKADTKNVCDQIRNAYLENDFKKALTLLSGLLAETPTEARVYKLMAKTYQKMGDAENAEKFAKAYEIFKTE